MGKIDIEQIRLPAERVACAQLGRLEPKVKGGYRPTGSVTERRNILGSALLLTDTMAPAAYAAAREAMAALEVDDRIELYQSTSRRVDTARLAVCSNPIGVEFIGNSLGNLDHGGLLALIGHEIGHSIAHMTNHEFAWALDVSQEPVTPTRSLYSLSAELTADRFGLIACGDLDVALRLEMQVTAGPASTGITFDTKAYLAQCRVIAEQTLAAGASLLGTSHPEHYIRGYAEWLFFETELFREITGKGPGARGLNEVNGILAKLLRIEVVAPSSAKGRDALAQQEKKETGLGSGIVAGVTTKGSAAASAVGSTVMQRVLRPTGNAITRLAGDVMPSIKAYADAALGSDKDDEKKTATTNGVEDEEPLADDDPLEEEQRELVARFDELEAKQKPKVRIGD